MCSVRARLWGFRRLGLVSIKVENNKVLTMAERVVWMEGPQIS